MSRGLVVVPPYSMTSCASAPFLIFGRGWTVSSQTRSASSWVCQ